ncbi:MAG: cytochrome c maturation protein CcmE [Nannocystis sp.]|jgi:cytochrome c-type biogenesis protein CcmE|nr:cytochrome c maturation protein CcmE [Nannocystis sp.]
MALPLATKVVIGLVIAGAVGYLVLADEGEGVLEYVYVEKVVAAPAKYQGRTIKVHGTVVPGTVRQKVGASGDYTFEIEREGRRLAVHYTNMVPDTFAEGGEVVLTGRLSGAGDRFDSDEMAAKCPSKYEEEPMAQR